MSFIKKEHVIQHIIDTDILKSMLNNDANLSNIIITDVFETASPRYIVSEINLLIKFKDSSIVNNNNIDYIISLINTMCNSLQIQPIKDFVYNGGSLEILFDDIDNIKIY